MQITHVHRVLHGIEAEIIRFAVSDAAFDAAAGHPHAEGVGVVIAPIGAALDHRSSSEFATPNDEGVVKQASLLEVFDQCRTGLFRVGAVLLQAADQSTVLIP